MEEQGLRFKALKQNILARQQNPSQFFKQLKVRLEAEKKHIFTHAKVKRDSVWETRLEQVDQLLGAVAETEQRALDFENLLGQKLYDDSIVYAECTKFFGEFSYWKDYFENYWQNWGYRANSLIFKIEDVLHSVKHDPSIIYLNGATIAQIEREARLQTLKAKQLQTTRVGVFDCYNAALKVESNPSQFFKQLKVTLEVEKKHILAHATIKRDPIWDTRLDQVDQLLGAVAETEQRALDFKNLLGQKLYDDSIIYAECTRFFGELGYWKDYFENYWQNWGYRANSLIFKIENVLRSVKHDPSIIYLNGAIVAQIEREVRLQTLEAKQLHTARVEAVDCYDAAFKVKPNDKATLENKSIALSRLRYPTPFKQLVDAYSRYFFWSSKNEAYAAMVVAASDSKKSVTEQLCSILQHLFRLKFLEAKYEKNDKGNYRLFPAREGEKEKLLKNLLSTWAKETKTIAEQYKLIECLAGLYLQNWFEEGWLDVDGWFVIESQEIESIVQLLKPIPSQFNFSNALKYEDFLLLILRIDAGFVKETAKQGISSNYLCGEQEKELKELLLWALKEVEEKHFKDDPKGYQFYLDNLKEKEKTQFFVLRQKQLGRAYTWIYTSRIPNIQTVPQVKWSGPVSKSVSLDEETKLLPAAFARPSSIDTKKIANQNLAPLPMAPETIKMNELLNRINTDGNDTKEFGGIFISRSDVRFNCFDKNSDYTADFINLLLYPLKESHLESIAVYPVATLKEFPKYFEDIEAQKQRYAFITLHVPYAPESPEDNNHWAALILDKEEQVIFYLDPATVGAPQAVEDLRSYLKYEKPIAINTINFQKAERDENRIRHCGAYVLKIFNAFAQCIRNHQTIIDTKNPIKSSDKERVSLSSVLETIPYGLNEAVVHRQNHIDTVCGILKTLPPVKPVAASEPHKKRTLAIVKTDPDEMIQFCFRINVMGDKAQLAIIAFHEVLLGRLESRKTTSEVMNSGIISYTEKGNWAKLKKAGWMILKSAPIAGKVLKYGHVGCQIVGEGLGMLADKFPWVELVSSFLESDAPWIEPVVEYSEYVKSGSKVSHAAIEFLDDHWESFKGLHNKVDNYFRKWIDGSEVDTHREYKQFYGIFRTDVGKDALNRFVHSLIDRYSRQLQLLEPEGAKQLAKAIDDHLSQLFLLDFTRWNLPRYGAQKHAMMLEIMRQWVTYMGFQKEKKVLLASGETATAEALLQHCGVYFEGGQQPIEINVIMDRDTHTKMASHSNADRYGYRKAERLLVEEFKGYLQNSSQLLQAYESQFAGQKTPEELEIFKELGHVMGIQFDSRTLSAFQQVKEINAFAEVVWQSQSERLGESEKKLCVVENKLEHVEESVGVITEKVEHLDSENKKFVTQETYDEHIGLMNKKLKDANDKAREAIQAAAAANKIAELAKQEAADANFATARALGEAQTAKEENVKLQETITELRGEIASFDLRLAKVEQRMENHAVLQRLQPDEAPEPPVPGDHLEGKIVDGETGSENNPINAPFIETEISDSFAQNSSEQLMEPSTKSIPYSPVLSQPRDLQKAIQISIQNVETTSPKEISPENVNLGFQSAVWWR